ncbi:Alpha-L-fucosidase [Melioribacter roseus P3M-2]|uniref:alpha-L-fucosidase n=1 Tax=Melioribacter roseus (strain DSM 23840 / JCM 17771 / VKM B-2668 / P3M-2) TaxID=1191523 RepID=I6Z6N3_MELRP|nr:alpha-L-fucosidase [Melioribacter roseus]AFN74825.1 Alpha-L-fucosidase [Melioribacter roseus P3M-2]
MAKEDKKPLHAGAVEIDEALKVYYPETDERVLKKLNVWQSLKFGLLMHWAPSSQWGIVESWSLCSEDEEWCKRNIEDYCEYKRLYENLITTFNPVEFNPEKWADAALAAGMKYFIFTTKHHDGFCMYDSNYTDYKITGERCPFRHNPNANITKALFDSFRHRNFMIGAYFSKPDWHSDYYWWRRFATPDRNVNYDIRKYPERWNKFVEFTHNQIMELMTDYGSIDILWLDGCWVRSYTEEELEAERKKANFNIYRIQNQDIKMPLLAKKAREKQPGLIIVDRAVPGPYQNYLTPENQIPENTLPYPWETCMPITPSWSYEPGLKYKSSREIIHLLIDIVSKGGNLLLNIAPTPEGDWEPEAYERLKDIGKWMKINGEAIYDSEPVFPYKQNQLSYTRNKSNFYAFYRIKEDENLLPKEINITIPEIKDEPVITVQGNDAILQCKRDGEKIIIIIPEELRKVKKDQYTFTMKIRT